MNTEKITDCWQFSQMLMTFSCFWCGQYLFGTNTIGGCFYAWAKQQHIACGQNLWHKFCLLLHKTTYVWLAGWLGDSAQICTYSKQLVIILQLRTGQQLCITSVCGWQFCTKQRFWQQTTRVPGDHFAQGITSVYGWQFCTNAQSKNPA